MNRRTLRIATVIAAALFAGVYADVFWSHPRPKPSDFGQLWAGARALVSGVDPYAVVGPGRAFEHEFPLMYPITAVITAIPYAAFPLRLADAEQSSADVSNDDADALPEFLAGDDDDTSAEEAEPPAAVAAE